MKKKVTLTIERIAPRPMPMTMSDFFYMNAVDPRRKPEIADSQMIQEDHRSIANLSEKAINRQWNPGKYSPEYWMESEVSCCMEDE